MNDHEKISSLEALLFIQGEPISKKKIAAILDMQPQELETVLKEFEQALSEEKRGLTLMRDEEKIQLVTKPAHRDLLEMFVKEQMSEELTPASLEALAIIAYLGPISRSRLDYLRGVNSVFILRNLLVRGLVERFPDPENSQAYLYRPTFEFLRHLGVSKRDGLPSYEKFHDLLKSFEAMMSGDGEKTVS